METIYGFILKNIFVSFLQVLVIEAETLQVKVSSTRKYIFHCQIRKCLNPGTTIKFRTEFHPQIVWKKIIVIMVIFCQDFSFHSLFTACESDFCEEFSLLFP